MNMENVIRSKKYVEMIDKAEQYYQLVRDNRENEQESMELKKQLDDIEAEFSDDPAYIAMLRAERRTR